MFSNPTETNVGQVDKEQARTEQNNILKKRTEQNQNKQSCEIRNINFLHFTHLTNNLRPKRLRSAPARRSSVSATHIDHVVTVVSGDQPRGGVHLCLRPGDEAKAMQMDMHRCTDGAFTPRRPDFTGNGTVQNNCLPLPDS